MPATPHVVVLAAGEGKRLGGAVPKVLTPLWGWPSLRWPIEAALPLDPARIVVVAGQHIAAIRQALSPLDGRIRDADRRVRFALQERPEGTGAAVLAAGPQLEGVSGPVLILSGDGPLVTTELLADLVAAHVAARAEVSVLTATLDDPRGYGRIVRDAKGEVQAIVEHKDADAATAAICEVNAGVWVLQWPAAQKDLRSCGSANAQGEVYLTDLVALVRARGGRVGSLQCDEPEQALGFNDQLDLALVRSALRRRILERHLRAGVEIVDPDTTFIDADVEIEPGARILPCTMIEGRCRLASGSEAGPFSHLRDGTVLEAGAEVGNFTETKKTTLGPGAKAKHLSYLGDATVGAKANIGAGTITANYDGKAKHPTHIGERAFIGSGSVLVAPAKVGDGATTGAGAILTRHSEVPDGETWVGVPARPLQRKRTTEDA